jgi:cytochrome c-type biogenesis protein CcmH/NrfG
MEANLSRTWPDPAGLGPPVSDQMTPELINEARKALQDAQRNATLARRAEETGRQGEALETWRKVLGAYFPLS